MTEFFGAWNGNAGDDMDVEETIMEETITTTTTKRTRAPSVSYHQMVNTGILTLINQYSM